jgi:capsular polysaccharide biosynthesis protein
MSDLRDYVDVLIHRWKLVVAMPVLAMLAAAGVALATKPTFEATAIVVLSPTTLSVPTSNQAPPYYLMADAAHQLPTAYTPTHYVSLLQGAEVVNAVNPPGAVSISPNGSDKSLIEITARNNDPQVAAQTANVYAQAGAARILQALAPSSEEATASQRNLDAAEQALVKFSQENGLGEYNLVKLRTGVMLSTAKQLELAQLLRTRDNAEVVYNDLARDWARASILAANTYKPTTILAPVPATFISPKPVQNVAIGAGLGLFVGVLGAFAVEYMTRKP